MNKVVYAHNWQSDHDPQRVVHAIEEVVKVSERLMKINLQMKTLVALANHFSIKAIGAARTSDQNKDVELAVHEACRLAETISTHSMTIGSMFSEIGESINTINSSIDRVLDELIVDNAETICTVTKEQHSAGSSAFRGAEAGRLNRVVKAADELTKIEEALSHLMRLVSRAKN